MAEQLLSTAVHEHDTLPGNNVRPEVVNGARIVVVDLGSTDRAAVVAALGDACRSHGFFQVRRCPGGFPLCLEVHLASEASL